MLRYNICKIGLFYLITYFYSKMKIRNLEVVTLNDIPTSFEKPNKELLNVYHSFIILTIQ